jgi:hypothetical protein
MESPITFPKAGSRVWTIAGLRQHGPREGPYVDVAPNTGGVITAVEKPWYAPTIGEDLYVVRWDAGQTTKHYFSEFGRVLCIGQYQTLGDFESALKGTKAAEVTWGPQGGFRGFRAVLHTPDGERVVEAVQSQRGIWEHLEPLLSEAGVPISEKRIAPAPRRKKKGGDGPA